MQTTAIVVLAFGILFGACERTPRAAALSGSEVSTASAAPAAAADVPLGVAENRSVRSAADPEREAQANAVAVSDSRRRDSVAMREITIPAGTRLPLVLDTTVGSDTSRVEQAVRAHVARPIVVGGVTILPTGSAVSGVVTSAVRSGRVKGRAHVAVRFESVTRRGDSERYRMTASPLARTAPATKKEDTLKVVAPAAGGAIIGRIAGGRKGAAIGTAVGTGAGGAVVMSTRGKEVRLGRGTLVTVRLSEPLTVRVPRG